jgi:thiamine biosynthesis lipoprotein
MGTFFEVDLRVDAGEAAEARAWLEWAREEITRLERIYSRHDPASELSELNRVLAEGALVSSVGPELARILAQARTFSDETEGAFDVTIGPLVDLWRDAAAADRWPDESEVRAAARRVGSAHFDLERQGAKARLHVNGARLLRLDLDGLSKGVALDRLRRSLRQRMPSAAALLSFGQSSLVAVGDADEPGEGWTLVIRSRDPSRVDPGRLRLRDRALSMSSSLGSVVEIAGREVSHVVDPRTGRAVQGTAEALVLAPSAAQADAWSTALLVLGARDEPQTAFDRLDALGLEARIFDASGASRATAGWPAATPDPNDPPR